MMMPSVGRVVHYMARGSADGVFPPACRKADVTEVPDPASDHAEQGRVGLCVVNPTGLFFHPLAAGGVEYDDDEKRGGTWHWPERV